MAESVALKGKKGWLKFLIFTCFGFGAISIFINPFFSHWAEFLAIEAYADYISSLSYAALHLNFLNAWCCVAASNILWQVDNRKAVLLAIFLMWIPCILFVIPPYIVIYNYSCDAIFNNVTFDPKLVREMLLLWVPEITRPVFWAGIFTVYLLTSKRVRNTYPRL